MEYKQIERPLAAFPLPVSIQLRKIDTDEMNSFDVKALWF